MQGGRSRGGDGGRARSGRAAGSRVSRRVHGSAGPRRNWRSGPRQGFLAVGGLRGRAVPGDVDGLEERNGPDATSRRALRGDRGVSPADALGPGRRAARSGDAEVRAGRRRDAQVRPDRGRALVLGIDVLSEEGHPAHASRRGLRRYGGAYPKHGNYDFYRRYGAAGQGAVTAEYHNKPNGDDPVRSE